MKQLKNSLTVRGDSLYCPLPLSLDTYGNCMTDCWHCYFRNLNNVWGTDLKPVDLELLDRKLYNGPRNKAPKTVLAKLLKQKKTIRFGNKADPFQHDEQTFLRSRQAINLLVKHDWTFVIQTRFTHIMMESERNILRAHFKNNLVTIMPVVSPGLDKDWEMLERKRTTPPEDRLRDLKKLSSLGIPGGVNGEPFIPGYHTVEDFEQALLLLKKYGIKSYNTYNFHFNAFVAKRLHAIGIDIEAIWYHNQDAQWKKILPQLLKLSKKHGIRLGCPDFVNTGKNWKEAAKTSCGINVPNPCTFNTHNFKRLAQEGRTPKEIMAAVDDGSGDPLQGLKIIMGEKSDFYTLKDVGFKLS